MYESYALTSHSLWYQYFPSCCPWPTPIWCNGNPKTLALQDKWGLHYFTQTLGWIDIASRNFLAAINRFQVLSGFVCHVIEVSKLPIDYRQRMDPTHMQALISIVWKGVNQADLETNSPAIGWSVPVGGNTELWGPMTKRKDAYKWQMNAGCRHVPVCVSKLVDIGGVGIPIERLQDQSWHTSPGNGLVWPDQSKPTKAHWKTLRRYLCHTFAPRLAPVSKLEPTSWMWYWDNGSWYQGRSFFTIKTDLPKIR